MKESVNFETCPRCGSIRLRLIDTANSSSKTNMDTPKKRMKNVLRYGLILSCLIDMKSDMRSCKSERCWECKDCGTVFQMS